MIEVSALLFTLLAEGTAVLSLILIIWIVLTIRKKSKDKAAAKELVGSIKQHSEDRLEAIESFIKGSAGLEADELQLAVKKLDRSEKDFFTQLVRLYLKRDANILSTMDEQLDKVIADYKSFAGQGEQVSSEEGEADASDKIATLEKEKTVLAEELAITKATMANMMSEFNTMFNGGDQTIQSSKEALKSQMSEVEDDVAIVEEAPTEEVVTEEAAVEEIAEPVEEPEQAPEVESETASADDIDDILFAANEPEEAPKASEPDMDDDIFFSNDAPPAEASAPQSISESDDNFGDIVSSDDVDDLLDGIDLSKEIDVK